MQSRRTLIELREAAAAGLYFLLENGYVVLNEERPVDPAGSYARWLYRFSSASPSLKLSHSWNSSSARTSFSSQCEGMDDRP